MREGQGSFFGDHTIRFVIVGSAAVLLDGSILSLLVHFGGWNPLHARVVSMSIAVVFAWLAHRHWTFPTGRLRSPLTQTILYGAVQAVGLSINYAVFTALIFAGGVWRSYPFLAVAAGALVTMTVSYVLSKTVAFGEPGLLARSRKNGLAQRPASKA